jgi:hypothetical protein
MTACLIGLMAGQAAMADCVSGDDLAGGIVARMDAGWRVRIAAEGGVVSARYGNAESGEGYRITGPFAVYPDTFVIGQAPPGVIGIGFDDTLTISRAGRADPPRDGLSVAHTLSVRSTLSDVVTGVTRSRYRIAASYQVSNPRTVELGGCTYDALTIEATFAGDPYRSARRWVYFSALGFGVITTETLIDGQVKTHGLMSLEPVQ